MGRHSVFRQNAEPEQADVLCIIESNNILEYGQQPRKFLCKGGYNTSSDYLTASVDANWYLNSGLFLNIRKAGVKIGISGMNLLYNDYKEKTRYKNISSVNINRFPRRTLYISVSYSFNNHKSAFRRNQSNADAVSRAN